MSKEGLEALKLKSGVEAADLEAFKKLLQQSTPDQTAVNRMLVQSLLSGSKDIFDYLKNEHEPKAELSAFTSENITTLITSHDFNVGEPPFDRLTLTAEDKTTRLKASREILTELLASNQNQKINLPAMASFFGDIELTQKLALEGRDFSQTIGRNATAITLSMSLADITQDNNYRKLTHYLLDNDLVDPSKQKTGVMSVQDPYLMKEFVQKLCADGKKLNIDDTRDIIISTPGFILSESDSLHLPREEIFNNVLGNMLTHHTQDKESAQVAMGILSKAISSTTMANTNEDPDLDLKKITLLVKLQTTQEQIQAQHPSISIPTHEFAIMPGMPEVPASLTPPVSPNASHHKSRRFSIADGIGGTLDSIKAGVAEALGALGDSRSPSGVSQHSTAERSHSPQTTLPPRY